MIVDSKKLLKLMVAVDSMAALRGQPSLAAIATDSEDGTGDFTAPIYDGWRAAIELLFSNPKMLEALEKISPLKG